MTHLLNRPEDFPGEAVDGFVAAHAGRIRRVTGGVVRVQQAPPGQVAVVVGGGSGHYPAFAGWVGPGMAHGAVCGPVFASPSAGHVESVVRAADAGGGVLLLFGNYAGDVLHFGDAAERLRAEGVDVRIVTITDDVASHTDPEQRRGIAGDLTVVKVAGAAAASGRDLDAVELLARRANGSTRTLGVAFSGCTLPGADAPLFTVPDGAQAIGLGIHGEPGLREEPRGTADAVADALLDAVLAESAPLLEAVGNRAAVVLNGLGATTSEELFVVYRRIAERLAGAGVTAVAPLVDDQVTSLDMAGLSLTITALDPELEAMWTAPVRTPALVRDADPDGSVPSPTTQFAAPAPSADAVPSADPGSRAAARRVLQALVLGADAVEGAAGHLGDLDAVAGDGDHGTGMARGTAGAVAAADRAIDQGAGVRTTLERAALAWSDEAGGTSGALWATALRGAAAELSDTAGPDAPALLRAVRAGADALLRRSGADVGDKTMLDAVVPFVDALESGSGRGEPLAAAWRTAAGAATSAAEQTAALRAAKGRARTHGDASLGHPDPGAVSFALLVSAVVPALEATHSPAAP